MDPRHIRHKPATHLSRQRPLRLACPQFRSGINLSRIVRLAGCAGIREMVVCGNTKVDPKIARDALDCVNIKRKRTLVDWLKKIRSEGACIVALEQSDRSTCLFDYRFQRECVLLVGHERLGIPDDQLALSNDVIEVPVYGQPLSYNVVTATTMAVYEYCRQFPEG